MAFSSKLLGLIWYVLLLILLSHFGYSQDVLGRHNIVKVEDKFNKLGGRFNARNAIVEDSLGFIWIGTKKGLCKYSGSTIDCFRHDEDDSNSIDANGIVNLFMDSDHLIWASVADKGVNVLDIHGKKIYDFQYIPDNPQSLLHDQIWGIWEDDDGYIWISYFLGGLSRFDKNTNTFTHHTIDDESFLKNYRPKAVVEARIHDTEPHTYWLATTGGLVKFNTRTFEHKAFIFEKKIEKKTSESQYNRNKLEPIWARTMCKDSHGNLWIGTYGALVKFNTQEETFEVLRHINGVLLNIIPGVINYDDDYIMISFSEGLALVHNQKNEIIILKNQKGASSNYDLYGRMYKTSHGCMYILSHGGSKNGVYKFCDNLDLVNNYYTDHYIWQIAATENYVHYHRKYGQIESKNFNTSELTNHFFNIKNGTIIRSMSKLQGDTILVSDVYHLYKYHPTVGLKLIPQLSQDDVSRHESVFRDSDLNIWNGRQRSGLFILNHDSQEVTHYDHTTKPSIVFQDYIVDFVEDKDKDVWLATELGWTIFNKKTNTTKNYKSKLIGAEVGLSFRTINALELTKSGTVWMATKTNGIIEWDKNKNKIVGHYSEKDGLRTNYIFDIVTDKRGHLWLATNNGVSWINTETDEIRNFGKEHGMNRTTYCIDISHDKLYIGHQKGYYSIHIDTLLQAYSYQPSPIITGFEVNNQSRDTLIYDEKGIDLKNDQNFFAINFGSINFYNSSLEEYEYRLVGVDPSWIKAREERTRGYTNVPPGEYEFQVRIKTEVTDYSTPATMKIQVQPAWYETIYFRILLAAAILGIILFYINSYIKRQNTELEVEKRFAELETMILRSQMNPHFIFNSLNSIRYLFMRDKKEEGIKYITKFAKLLRTILNQGEHPLVSLKEEMELTNLFIQLEQLRFDDKFNYNFRAASEKSWEQVKIPPFIIQPIVENAFWHGLLPSSKESKILDINIQQISTGFLIVIEDNGVGFSYRSPSKSDSELEKTKSYGLKVIRERLNLLNKNGKTKYKLAIKASEKYSSGTRISIDITL